MKSRKDHPLYPRLLRTRFGSVRRLALRPTEDDLVVADRR